MKLRPALLAVPAVALALPASASALIQTDEGIAGARLNNTKQQVRTALGQPIRIQNGKNDFGPFTVFHYRGGIRVTFQSGNRVTSVFTNGVGDRTRRGIGVGSTEAAVRQRVDKVKCETIVGFRSCHTGSFTAGRRVTDFAIRGGRVRSVTLGFVID
ncbi:MAG: hypothetical protein ACM3UV_08065 [Nocardioidaceae bacterium]